MTLQIIFWITMMILQIILVALKITGHVDTAVWKLLIPMWIYLGLIVGWVFGEVKNQKGKK